MNKWNRVPSICLRSPTGWRARLRVPWLNPQWSSSAWAGFRGEDGWCIWAVSSDTSLNGPLKASAGRREALIPHLPHLAPFTEHTCTLPTAFPTHVADEQSPLFPFLHKYFQDVQKKDVGTYSECLPSERVCPCKHGCMRAHISEIRILLCRCVSNPEPFKMLIFVCFHNILIHCSLNEGSQAFFIPLQLPNGHWYKNLLPQKNVPKEQQMQWIVGIGLKPFLSVYSNNPL